MDKNFFIAIIVTTIVVIVFTSPQYQQKFGKPLPKKPFIENTTAPKDTSDSSEKIEKIQQTTPIPVAEQSTKQDTTTVAVSPAKNDSLTTVQINKPEKVTDLSLKNEDINITVSSRGGIITSAFMLKYDGPSKSENPQIIRKNCYWYSAYITDNNKIINLDDFNFVPEINTQDHIFLKAEISDGRSVIREYKLDKTGFIIHAETKLEGTWQNPKISYVWSGTLNETERKINMIQIWPFSMFSSQSPSMYNKAAYIGDGDRITFNGGGKEKRKRIYSNESAQKVEAKSQGEHKDMFEGDLKWYAIRSKYFMSAALPKENKLWDAVANYSSNGNELSYDFTISKRLSDGSTALDIYSGPIILDTLKQCNETLPQIMELSWSFIRPLSIGFLWLIRFLHQFISNWGLVIIAFSILIKIILYPLAHSSFVSMRKMAALQPQINELREKHKSQPQKFQHATMELYKKEGVNPFGGCLPLLLQMPVFFALYPVIDRSFELRQAMFIPNWINDLSRPDPLFILPVAMGISMYFQTKPTAGNDPNQKIMLYVMPVMMVILFANFSAGLTLYWLLYNIMSWAQQVIHTPKTAKK